ncbi:MAG: hypothetical protein KF789_02280 [Bdellovibrionaceae bacterium]|nr:hypothetical protein [Pseudobdellovibrionaceae bacterium]
MRFVFFAALTLLASGAFAEPIALSGTYQFKGRVEPIMRQTFDVLLMTAPGAKDRLNQLKSQGATCMSAPAGRFRCITIRPPREVAPASLRKIADRHQGLRIQMGQVTANPVLVIDGEVYRQWEISQNGTWNGGSFQAYRYNEKPESVSQIVLPGRFGLESGFWLIVENSQTLRHLDEVTFHENANRWHIDSAQAVLE